jgi:hypothetical protein
MPGATYNKKFVNHSRYSYWLLTVSRITSTYLSDSKADLPYIIRYIHHQQEHHTRKTFLEEYLGLLKEFDIEYDDRFVFKPLGIEYIVPNGTY